MTDNYPPGAANDPNAPYNEVPPTEVEVTVTTRLYKETVIYCDTHKCVEYEIDPDTGRREAIQYTECDNVKERYEEQEDSPYYIMRKCIKICRKLREDGHRYYAGINLCDLIESCAGWEEEEVTVHSS